MRFSEAQAAGLHIHRAYEPIEYPKWVTVDGKSVMALDADHEIELLGSQEQPSADHSSEGSEQMNNLLSAPEKRKGGRPRLIRDEDGNVIRNTPTQPEQGESP